MDHPILRATSIGGYYLARVLSGWEYLTSKEAEDADIVNVVRCRILAVPRIDLVPGKVVACFRPSRTIQSVKDHHVRRYSAQLWNRLSDSVDYPDEGSGSGGVFSFLGAEETEDVLFLFLQTQDWLVVPHSRKADTMRFEFYCIHRKTKRRAIVQVKTGNSWLRTADWEGVAEYVILFQSNGLYDGAASPGIETLNPEVIEAFMAAHRDLLPENILFWLDCARAVSVQRAEVAACDVETLNS